MEVRVRRREKRELRFVRLEKTSFPKTESPLEVKLLKKKKFKAPDEEKTITIIKKKEQSTNSEVKTDPAVDFKLAIKHDLAGLSSRVMEAPFS